MQVRDWLAATRFIEVALAATSTLPTLEVLIASSVPAIKSLALEFGGVSDSIRLCRMSCVGCRRIFPKQLPDYLCGINAGGLGTGPIETFRSRPTAKRSDPPTHLNARSLLTNSPIFIPPTRRPFSSTIGARVQGAALPAPLSCQSLLTVLRSHPIRRCYCACNAITFGAATAPATRSRSGCATPAVPGNSRLNRPPTAKRTPSR